MKCRAASMVACTLILAGCASSRRVDDLERRVNSLEEIQELQMELTEGNAGRILRSEIRAKQRVREQWKNTQAIRRAALKECWLLPWRCW